MSLFYFFKQLYQLSLLMYINLDTFLYASMQTNTVELQIHEVFF
jgi:hypothetical protein